MAVAEVTDATFDSEVLKAEKPVIVDFWAPWCVPCRRVSPILDQMKALLDGQLSAREVATNLITREPKAE